MARRRKNPRTLVWALIIAGGGLAAYFLVRRKQAKAAEAVIATQTVLPVPDPRFPIVRTPESFRVQRT